MLTNLCFLIFLISPTLGKNIGRTPVNRFGYIYVVADEGNIRNIEMHEEGFSTLIGGGGIHFAKEPSDDFIPDMYWAVSR